VLYNNNYNKGLNNNRAAADLLTSTIFFQAKTAVPCGRRDVIVGDVTSSLPAEQFWVGEEPPRGSVKRLASPFDTHRQADRHTHRQTNVEFYRYVMVCAIVLQLFYKACILAGHI
jgi:hypothetical protein